MTTHTLKITDGWWKELALDRKRFELRRNDRDYQIGDHIKFTNIVGAPREHESKFWVITHVLTDVDGLQNGYAGISLRRGYQ